MRNNSQYEDDTDQLDSDCQADSIQKILNQITELPSCHLSPNTPWITIMTPQLPEKYEIE